MKLTRGCGVFICQTRDFLNESNNLDRGLVGDSVDVGMGGGDIILVEVEIETADEFVLVFKAFGVGALRAC